MNAPPTVLLVEDDENDIFFLRSAARKAELSAKLQVVMDGARAIEYLEGRGEFADRVMFPLPHIILLDLKLPGVMGIDVLRWIRERRSFDTTPVIILSASHLAPDISLAFRCGANSFLTKPNNPHDLVTVLDLIDRYWLGLNQPMAGTRRTSARKETVGTEV